MPIVQKDHDFFRRKMLEDYENSLKNPDLLKQEINETDPAGVDLEESEDRSKEEDPKTDQK